MRNNRKLIALLFSCTLPVSAGTFDAQELENLAERDGYGYKAANLMLLRNMLSDVDGFTVRVPDFSTISSATIQNLLDERGIDLAKEWSQIVVNLNLEQILSTKTFPAGFLDASRALAKKIRETFRSADFSSFSRQDLANLRALLTTAENEDWRLMVRSTGKEDTDKLANAGGNLSVANVSPDSHAVFTAIGQVIASYFEDKSLSQRLIAGDITLADKPLTPVLIQRMVGETLNNGGPNASPSTIPVGCVLYTQETAGRLEGIHTLQCSFGHNEGVVQSLVPLDTFYLPKDAKGKSIIKNKPKRIAPVFENGVFGLEEVLNPTSIQSMPSLTENAVRAISKVGDQIDRFYEKRMDIELVFEPSSKTIYIVQARPLVLPKSDKVPSFIARPTDFAKEAVASLYSVEIGNASVQRITHANQILLAKTLDEALDLYTRAKAELPDAAPRAVEMMEPPILEDSEPIAEVESPSLRKTVKAIIVSRQADATSHAAAVFRGDGKTIYVSSDLNKIAKWMDEPEVDVLLDGQRGLAVNIVGLEEQKLDTKALFEQRILKPGWINYPLPLRVSIDTHLPQYCVAPVSQPRSLFSDFTCLVDRLQNEVFELQRFVQVTRSKAHCDDKAPGCLDERVIARQALPKLENLSTLAHEISSEMRKAPRSDDVVKLIDLFPKRFFEALIYQKPDSEFVNAYSVESVRQDYERRQQLVDEVLRPLIDAGAISDVILRDERLFEIAEEGSKASLTNETTTRFLQLIDELGSNKANDDIDSLQELTEKMNHLGILPMWINSLFIQAAQRLDRGYSDMGFVFAPSDSIIAFHPQYGLSRRASADLLHELYQDYDASRLQLSVLAEKKTMLHSYDVSRFERPENFARNRADLKSRFINYFVSRSFLDFKSSLYAIAATSLMETFVERFDTSIKVLKSTRNYPNKEADFKALLEDYFSVLAAWAPVAPKDHIFFNPEWPLKIYLDRVQQLLSNKTHLSESELLPTPEFSVSGAALGSGANFIYYNPKTLEDLFTLIHQSLNSVMSAFIAEHGTALALPSNFTHVLQGIYKTQGHPFPSDQTFIGHGEHVRVILTGISVDDLGVSYLFNLPLRWHSAKIVATYLKEADSTKMSFWVLGDSDGRWEKIVDFCEIKSDLLKTPYIEPILNEQEFAFTFSAVDQISSDDLKDIIIGAVDMTFEKAPRFESDMRTRSYALEQLFDDYVSPNGQHAFSKARLVIQALLAKDKGVSRAEVMTKTDFSSLSEEDRDFRLFVLEQLVKNGHSFSQAELITKELIKSNDPSVRFLAEKVLIALIERNQGLEFAQFSALQALKESDIKLRLSGWRTLLALVRSSRALAEAQNLIPDGLSSSRDSERYFGLQILNEFIKRGLLVEQAERLARPMLGIEAQYIKIEVIRTAILLIQKAKGLTFADEVIDHFRETDDPWVRRTLEELILKRAGAPKDEL